MLSRLTTILQEMDDNLISTETSINDFSDPNWSHKQAFRNGQRATLKELKQLLEFIA